MKGFFLFIGIGIVFGGVGRVRKELEGWFGIVILFVFFDGMVEMVCFCRIFFWLYMLFKSKGLKFLVIGLLGVGFDMLFIEEIKVSF